MVSGLLWQRRNVFRRKQTNQRVTDGYDSYFWAWAKIWFCSEFSLSVVHPQAEWFFSVGRIAVATKFNLKSFVWGKFPLNSREIHEKIQIFQVSTKFGFTGFPENNHSSLSAIYFWAFRQNPVPRRLENLDFDPKCGVFCSKWGF